MRGDQVDPGPKHIEQGASYGLWAYYGFPAPRAEIGCGHLLDGQHLWTAHLWRTPGWLLFHELDQAICYLPVINRLKSHADRNWHFCARIDPERLQEPQDQVMKLGGAHDRPGDMPLLDDLFRFVFGLIVGIGTPVNADNRNVNQVRSAVFGSSLHQCPGSFDICLVPVLSGIGGAVDDCVRSCHGFAQPGSLCQIAIAYLDAGWRRRRGATTQETNPVMLGQQTSHDCSPKRSGSACHKDL